MSPGRTAAVLLLGCLSIVALAGCAGAPVAAASSEPQESYLCGGTPVSAAALSARTPVAELTGTGQEALSGAKFDDGSPLELGEGTDWFVVEESEQSLTILRDIEVMTSTVSPAIPADHEMITVSWIEASNIEPGWYVGSMGPCALTIDLGDLTVPLITLDPEHPIDPASRELHVLVTEQNCNSGADAEGRIEIVRVDEGSDQIDLVLGVRPRDGGQNCPSNPATPFTVTLAEPIGERLVINGTLQNQSPLTDG